MPRGMIIPGWNGLTDLNLTNTTGSDQITTLTGEAFYRNITLNATAAGRCILRPAGYAIVCDVLTLTNSKCLIQNNASNGASGSNALVDVGGAGDPALASPVASAAGYQTFFSGGGGGGGHSGGAGNGVGGYSFGLFSSDMSVSLLSGISMGGTGGAGGDVTGASSQNGGTGGQSLDGWMAGTGFGGLPNARGGPFNPQTLINGYFIFPQHSGGINGGTNINNIPANAKFAGGGGGGGGASNNANVQGGDGGGGGGGIYIVCRRLDISGGGIIEANGGNGGNATGTPGASQAAGGGAGGGGGAIVLIFGEMFTGTGIVRANGGNGGNGVAGSGATTLGGRGGQGGGIFYVSDTGNQFVRGTSGANGTP